jgi:NAD-dependent deacetylase
MFAKELIDKLQSAQHLVVLTGAGVSAESGIPTFRDALTGLWSQFSAEALASESGFQSDPALVWGWYEWRRQRVIQAKPNPAHTAVAQLQHRVPKLTLITQNVDDLHERAGSTDVLHLHGSLNHPRCINCQTPYELPEITSAVEEAGNKIEPPRCFACGGMIRPGVVWFGEILPMQIWEKAVEASKTCDVMMVIGTSGMVYPAASLPFKVESGCTLIHVNPTVTSFSSATPFNLYFPAGEVLPKLVQAAFGV